MAASWRTCSSAWVRSREVCQRDSLMGVGYLCAGVGRLWAVQHNDSRLGGGRRVCMVQPDPARKTEHGGEQHDGAANGRDQAPGEYGSRSQ